MLHPPDARVESACRAPHHSPAPDVCPIASRSVAAASSAGVPEGGQVRRELRQHLAVQGAVEQGRREQGGPVEGPAYGRRHVVGQPVGRDEHGQPAAQHVVAERRRARRRCRRGRAAPGRRFAQEAGGGRRARLRPVGGTAPPQSPGSPPEGLCRGRSGEREHPRIVRRGGGFRPDTGSRAQHRGCRRRRREPAGPTRPRPERRSRRAQGTWAAPGPTTPTQRPATSTYTAAGVWCSTRTGPSAAERRWSTTRGGALPTSIRDHASRRYRPPLHLPL